MNINRTHIFSILLGLLVTTDIINLFNLNFSLVGDIITLITLLTVPGSLILLLLKLKSLSFWESTVYIIGLSLSVLMFGGLLINQLFPLLHIQKPLSPTPVLFMFNVVSVVLAAFAYKKNEYISVTLQFLKPNKLSTIFYLVPFIFVILSILGAVSLNNGGSDMYTLSMLGIIGLSVLLLTIFRKKISSSVYPFSLFFIGLSLLLMTSLRGWYITGHDVQLEYYVFQLTKNNALWNINVYRDAYNAMLSITILPTIFSNLVHLKDIYIYKVLYQILFSFTPVMVYLFLKKYTTTILAFFSAFYFSTFPIFYNDMPMLNRQEIAFFFFTLLVLMLFNQKIPRRKKELLTVIFGFSMAVSHYSTMYIVVVLFILTVFISLIFRKRYINKLKLFNQNYYLTWIMVAALFLFTFLWNAQITKTTGVLTTLVSDTWQNIGKTFSQELKANASLYNIFSWQKIDKEKQFNEYITKESNSITAAQNKNVYYDKSTYKKYNIQYIEDETLPLTNFGKILSKVSINAFSLNNFIRQGSAKIVQIFIFVGLLVFIFKYKSYINNVDPEYGILAFVSLFILVLFILLPLFSVEYGTLRLFQQVLVFLALPLVTGCFILCRFLSKTKSHYIVICLLILFFFSSSGLLPQITGGYYPLLNLDNKGIYYDAYYTHRAEYEAIKWLSANYNDNFTIQSDIEGSSKMLAISQLYASSKMLPAIMPKESYVYLDYSNVVNKKNIIDYNGDIYFYKYPTEFLDNNKNLIYDNLGSEIYK